MKRLAYIIKKYDKLKSNMVRAIYSNIAEEGSKGVFRLERKTEFAVFFAIILFQFGRVWRQEKKQKSNTSDGRETDSNIVTTDTVGKRYTRPGGSEI